MEPNKKIPSFCFESPWLKPMVVIARTWTLLPGNVGEMGIDVEAELTALLSAEINAVNMGEMGIDVVTVQPLEFPTGGLFYMDFHYDNRVSEPKVYDDGSWSMGNTFEGVIGIKSEIKPHTFI